MSPKKYLTLYTLTGILLMASCRSQPASPTPAAVMPNPASVYCEQNGGTLELRQDASGGVAGICHFPDGSECDEWAYFRGECQPGDSLEEIKPTPAETGEATDEGADDGWATYRNESLGYSFDYPAEASIAANEDPLKGVSITGPLKDDEHWPMIYVDHPDDREDYRPPEGTDLAQWLSDHNLLADERQDDLQIAGNTAIHTRHERSPQSYAYDRYYFARGGQLYVIVILHAGDKEDWELYNRFLESIRFE